MLYVFLAGLIIVITIFILIIKEFVCTSIEMRSIEIELKKYTPKNRYQMRKILTTIKQSKKIITSSGSIEERIYWLNIMLNSFRKLKRYLHYELLPKVELYEKKCVKELQRLENKRHGDDDSKKVPKSKKKDHGSSSSNVA